MMSRHVLSKLRGLGMLRGLGANGGMMKQSTGIIERIAVRGEPWESAPVFSARWSRKMREDFGNTTVDDPPTGPLPEEHELEGYSDWSNWYDTHPDTPSIDVLYAMVLFFGPAYLIYLFSKWRGRKVFESPSFTLNCIPYDEQIDGPIAHYIAINRERKVEFQKRLLGIPDDE
uniref:Uncharacterized protein n=1 Tax=Timspurckia oligopyrenoides TaxID=708627 RepID=A0A7S0ZCS3_9RHOD|mmetsp:Transcript_12778/g.22977  ORF Transcript_12778/g.22977 Transcript_12778/m.22977 type:complete len:173 (+) Transcript_12778:114-632(+)